jgi:hypothetical protein
MSSLTPTKSNRFAYGINSVDGGFDLRRLETWFYMVGTAVQVDVTFTYGLNMDDISITGPVRMYVNGSGTALETFNLNVEGTSAYSTSTSVTFTNQWISYSTVRIEAVITGNATFYDVNDNPQNRNIGLTTDVTLTIKNPTSITGSLLTITGGNPVLNFQSPSTLPILLHIKHLGTGTLYIRPNASIDGDSSMLQIPANAGITLFRADTVTNLYIASYYTGTLTTGTTTVTATTATSPIVLANINSTDKTVGLPNPATFQSSYLCVCGYGTGTSTPTGKLYVLTNNYSTEAPGSTRWFRFDPAGRSVGVLFVSDGSKWHVVGVYLGGVTTYDTTTTQYTTVTSTIALASSSSANAISPGSVTTADSGLFQIWKAIENPFAASAVIGNGTNYVINSSANRLYRNDGADFTSFIYVNTKVGAGGTPTVFPVAQYPAEK